MSIFKCKMCGGDIELSADKTFGTCECCGTSMTFPKINDEQRLAMFNRGNAFRRAGEFDKALALYENIVREDDTDAEAHWCCALCRFGIEYVEDPATFEYVPTCHRASFDSFLDDVDYKAAVNNADGLTKRQYQKDALKIADVQKGILATSQNEEPFDVFICYKETDDVTGQRTRDSIDAQEIYYQLTNEGYRVFFSRITLEDKAGAEYEPYIFAALNSAKVMVVIGSKPEYFNAVWVKNEWSRFIAMMRKDRSKLLLPCYRDIDPYDLPEQLSVLQSYDMTKIGFIQDLIRGIKKITASDEPKAVVKETVVVNNSSTNSNVTALKKRGFMALEDGEWAKADDFFEEALNQDAEDAECYLGKLMAELQVKTKDNIKNAAESFENNNNCIKASRFDPAIAEELKADNEFILERNENTRKTKIYNSALEKMKSAKKEADFKSVAESFNSIKGFKDADDKAKECNEKAEIARKDEIYNSAEKLSKEGFSLAFKKINLTKAIEAFESISDWKDSKDKIEKLQLLLADVNKGIADERIAAEKAKEKSKKIAMVVLFIFATVVVFLIVLNKVIIPAINYKKAIAELDANNYRSAIDLFSSYPDYKDTDKQIEKCRIGIFGEDNWNLIKNAKVGDNIRFGNYEQDNEISNGKEVIKWRVLDIEDNKLLIISEKSLDCRKFNDSSTGVTWETCTLREWMNNEFYNAAFNDVEKDSIIPKEKISNYSSDYDTTDKVFLLSTDEANKYFSSDEDRKCVPTAYTVSNGAWLSNGYTKGGEATSWWWLRSVADDGSSATVVVGDGSIFEHGDRINLANDCVRPAMWIEIPE